MCELLHLWYVWTITSMKSELYFMQYPANIGFSNFRIQWSSCILWSSCIHIEILISVDPEYNESKINHLYSIIHNSRQRCRTCNDDCTSRLIKSIKSEIFINNNYHYIEFCSLNIPVTSSMNKGGAENRQMENGIS